MKKCKCSLASVISQYCLIKLFNSFQIRKKKRQTGIMHKLQPNSYKDVKTPGPWQKNQEALQSSSWKARLCDPPPSLPAAFSNSRSALGGLSVAPFLPYWGQGQGVSWGSPQGKGNPFTPAAKHSLYSQDHSLFPILYSFGLSKRLLLTFQFFLH